MSTWTVQDWQSFAEMVSTVPKTEPELIARYQVEAIARLGALLAERLPEPVICMTRVSDALEPGL